MNVKKMKILIIIVWVVFFTGCDATYNIEIKDGKIMENFTFEDSNRSKWDIDYFGGKTYADLVSDYNKMYVPALYSEIIGLDELAEDRTASLVYGIPYYRKLLVATGNQETLGMKFSYDYDLEEYFDSTIANHGVGSFRTEIIDEHILTISSGTSISTLTDNEMLDRLTINIVTNNKVIEHNADKVSYNKYTWIINKSEFEKHEPIIFALDLNETITTIGDVKSIVFLVCLGLAIFVGIVVVVYQVVISKKRNREV